MRRADRLFQIIQILRRSSRPTTASMLAAELEVTVRTVYRDVTDLMGQRVPIRGEAGVGYVLDRDYDMPALMLSADDLEAAVLGAQWVAARGDPGLARAARDLLAKISGVIPDHLRPFIADPGVGVAPARTPSIEGPDVARLRGAIHAGCKVRIRYRDEAGHSSERVVWPVMIGYTETVRLLAAWCEWRHAFRHFRIDRIEVAAFLDEPFGRQPGDLRRDWKRQFEAERGVRLP